MNEWCKYAQNFFKKCILPYWKLIALVIIFVAIRIATIEHNATPLGGGIAYIEIGKFLFSHGTVGMWEIARPIGLPIILGSFWKIGINPYAAGEVTAVIVSMALLVLVHFFSEEIRPRTGIIASTILAATGVFFSNSALPITDIISTFFAVLSLFLIYRAKANHQYFIAGSVIALGFMFHFPQGLLLVVGMIAVAIKFFYEPTLFKYGKSKQKLGERVVTAIERMFSIGGGFFLITVPYLVCNYYFYHNAFLPFIQGVAVVKLYPILYQNGPLFYFITVLKADPIFVLALLPIGLLWKKEWRTKGLFILITAIVLVGGYFTYQVHKEARYVLVFLPYIAMLSAFGIVYILEYFKLPQLLFFGLFFIIGFMVTVGLVVNALHDTDSKFFYDFNSHFNKAPVSVDR